MNLLESLSAGLRNAAGVLNPEVQRETFAADERQQNLRQQQQFILVNHVAQQVQQGAMSPEQGKALLSRIGVPGDFAGGPGVDVRKKQEDAVKEAQYQQALIALGPNPTQEQLASVAARFSDAKTLLTSQTASLDRQAQIAATKEAATARIQQSAQQFSDNMDLKIRNANNADDRLLLEQQKAQGMMRFQAAHLNQTGQRLLFDTGMSSPTVTAPNITGGSPQQAPVANLEGDPRQVMVQISQIPDPATRASVLEAYRAQLAQGGSQAAPAPQAAPVAQEAPYTPAPPNNFDRWDLQAQAAARQVAPAAPIPASAVVAPKQLTIADAPEGLTGKNKQAWLLAQTKPSVAGAGTFTPESLKFLAQQYLTGDRQAVQGFARSATARIALQNAIVDEAAIQGMSPQQTAAKIAEFAGTMAGSRTVGTRAANISLAATEAVEMLDLVKETSDKFSRTKFIPWNMALRAYETNTGAPEIAEFGASVNALVNVYARAINPTGVPTVSDKEHARAVLNTVQSPAQVDAVLGIIRRELEIAKKAPGQVTKGTSERITGKGTEAPAATAAPTNRALEDALKRYK